MKLLVGALMLSTGLSSRDISNQQCKVNRARDARPTFPQARALSSCPTMAWTCCDAEMNQQLLQSNSACASMQPDTLAEQCCNALSQLSCNVCDGYVGIGQKNGICAEICSAAYEKCASSMFEASARGILGAAGSLKPCDDDSVLCARLSGMFESAGTEASNVGSLFCTSLGYTVAREEQPCYDGSSVSAPEGWVQRKQSSEPTVHTSEGTPASYSRQGGAWRPWHWSLERWVGEMRARSARGDLTLFIPPLTLAIGFLGVLLYKQLQSSSRHGALAAAVAGYDLSEEEKRALRLRRFETPAAGDSLADHGLDGQ